MKKYSKSTTFVAIIIFMFTLSLQSCDNTYTKKNAKIEKYLAERNFDKAREVAQQIPSDEYYFNKNEGNKRHYYQQDAMIKINKAQLSLMTAEGQWDDARAFAQELDALNIYQELFGNNINKLLQNRQYETILLVLSSWKIENPYRETVDNHTLAGKGGMYEANGNVPYNEEVQAYNKIVDAVIQYAIINDELKVIKKCVALYKPEAVYVKYEYGDKGIYTLKNNAKELALQNLKENGITL